MTRGSEGVPPAPQKLTARLTALLTEHHLGFDPNRMVLFVDRQAEKQLEEEALSGALGDWLKCQVVVRGVRRAFPRVAGFVVVWDHHEFTGKNVETLTMDEMRLVVKAQQEVIETLHEHQRRL